MTKDRGTFVSTGHTDLLQDFQQCLEWLSPADATEDDEQCANDPEHCCMECRYLGCIAMKLRTVREALKSAEVTS